MRPVQRGERDADANAPEDPSYATVSSIQGNLDCCSLILIASHAQPYTRLSARAEDHRCGWNALCLS